MHGLRVCLVAFAVLVAGSPAAHAVELTSAQTGTRGERYCELLFVKPRGLLLTATVWTTYTQNACPVDAWNRVNTTRLSLRSASLALRNGPRYWTIDAIESDAAAVRPVRTFDGLAMRFGATVSIPPSQLGPYRAQRVTRRSVFIWDSGQTVFELTSPSGRRYVMQSYSQQVDRTLGVGDLPGLAPRLRLPAGWTYSSRVLDATLRIDTTDAPAEVLPDRLGNSYTFDPASTTS